MSATKLVEPCPPLLALLTQAASAQSNKMGVLKSTQGKILTPGCAVTRPSLDHSCGAVARIHHVTHLNCILLRCAPTDYSYAYHPPFLQHGLFLFQEV
ncbi:hypothetical protein DFH94DRAFT_711815 [Russula ochroleuca]|uniref:Uncharacterized protein n=1 Tax=Russula ochroleuca TaxID=152965 RepID=A0A9P5N4F5_9AGAM|nr:hypothetical protein DFH94DRAFT_711815 [Russula ochroleuca]